MLFSIGCFVEDIVGYLPFGIIDVLMDFVNVDIDLFFITRVPDVVFSFDLIVPLAKTNSRPGVLSRIGGTIDRLSNLEPLEGLLDTDRPTG